MFWLIFVAFVLWIIFHRIQTRRRDELLSKIPSPRKRLVLHNALEFIGKSPRQILEWMEQMSIDLGPVYHFTVSSFDSGKIIVRDPKIVKVLLTNQKNLDKTQAYRLLRVWLGEGLLIADGDKWHQRRKLLTPAFHASLLDKYFEVMEKQTKILIEILTKFDGKEVNVAPLINVFALDTISESAMGCAINSQLQDSVYLQAVREITEMNFFRFFDAIRRHQAVHRLTEMYQREKKLLKVLHDFTDSVIKSRREEMLKEVPTTESSKSKKLALLDLLLNLSVEGKHLSDEDIREEIDTFMFAGHDTTAAGISFALFNIAKHPEIQEKVLKEIQSTIGDETVSKLSMSNMHYLDNVIKESLRLFPPVPFFGRCLSEEIVAGGFTFPKNSNVVMAPYLMGRDPHLFRDPLKFNPDRFDDDEIDEFSFVPFSAGLRNCIGQKFALLELKLAVAEIVKNFELSISKENENLELVAEIVLKSMNGVNLIIRRRV